jgi:hypothetical protein
MTKENQSTFPDDIFEQVQPHVQAIIELCGGEVEVAFAAHKPGDGRDVLFVCNKPASESEMLVQILRNLRAKYANESGDQNIFNKSVAQVVEDAEPIFGGEAEISLIVTHPTDHKRMNMTSNIVGRHKVIAMLKRVLAQVEHDYEMSIKDKSISRRIVM